MKTCPVLGSRKVFPLYRQQSSILDLFFLAFNVLKHITMCNCYRLSFFKLFQPSLFWQAQNARESSTSITNILLSSSFWEQSRWKDSAGISPALDWSVQGIVCLAGAAEWPVLAFPAGAVGTANISLSASFFLISSEFTGNSLEFVSRSKN